MNITKNIIVSVIGRPNVGKSTLANAIAGEKIAIVSPKPQTTRNRIYAIKNRGETQFIFVDTPGYHKPHNKLDEFMVQTVKDSFKGVDAIVLMIENGRDDPELFEMAQRSSTPAVLVINKIDLLESKAELLPLIEKYSGFEHIVPISAKNADGIDELLNVLEPFAQSGSALFPEEMTTDQDDVTVVGELVREKLLMCLDHEIPHGTAVEVTRFSERIDTEIVDVEVTIYCERESHKRIIIGKRGSMIKRVGELARKDIERFMGAKVFLQTWVKVKEGWRDMGGVLKDLGYVSNS